MKSIKQSRMIIVMAIITIANTQFSFAQCSDGDTCTIDYLDSLSVCHNDPINCDDGIACTVDGCDSTSGCFNMPDDMNCDDLNACTLDDCNAVTGCLYTVVDCDDSHACTSDQCDTVTGCVYITVNCSDSNECTLDSCDSATGCFYTVLNCNDSDACTMDGCDTAAGCYHSIIDCDDSNACTSDSCENSIGCFHTPLNCTDIMVYYRSDSIDSDSAATILDSIGNVKNIASYFNRIDMEVDSVFISSIEFLPWVSGIATLPAVELNNDESRARINADDIQSAPWGPNNFTLTGNNVNVGMWDGGCPEPHLDYNGRVICMEPLNSYPQPWFHATHVCGTIGGDGTNSFANGGTALQWTGMAPAANIFGWSIDGTNIPDEQLAGSNNQHIVISNNSWSYIGASGYTQCQMYNGVYFWACGEFDRLVRDNGLIPFFSAGNYQGELIALGCANTRYGTVSSPGTSKNGITIGAIDKQDRMTGFSGWGPTADGRLKPDIVAIGANVTSCGVNNSNYISLSGVSMAVPAAAGTGALLVEHFRNLNGGNDPDPALLKAIMLNTAEDFGNPGPDFQSGYGVLNALRAAEVISINQFLTSNVAHSNINNHALNIPNHITELNVMLVYSDEEVIQPNLPFGTPVLVNNLDIQLIDPNGGIHLPLTLDPTPGNENNIAVPAVNTRDNVEQVIVQNPMCGTWTVRISGSNVPVGPQGYAVTWDFPPPVPFNVLITPNNPSLCQGGAVALDAGFGFSSYSWSPGGGTTQIINVNAAGIYSVTVSNANNCTASDDVLVTAASNPTVTVLPSHVSCSGSNTGSATANVNGGSPPYTFHWFDANFNPLGNNQTIFNLAAGTYWVNVVDAQGCFGASAVTILSNGGSLADGVIMGNVTWGSNQAVSSLVTLQCGSRLTILPGVTVWFAEDAKIVIERGAKLVLDGCTLTSCGNVLWGGIEVYGNTSLPLPVNINIYNAATHPYPASCNDHGVVVAKNGALIENATTAITLGSFSGPNLNYGGILFASNKATFRNNQAGIVILPATIGSPNTNGNRTTVINCVFETTKLLNEGASPLVFVFNGALNGYPFFRGNIFINSATGIYDPDNRGYGILSWGPMRVEGAQANILNYLPSTLQNIFENLTYGIWHANIGSPRGARINRNIFTDCKRGIYLSGADYAVVNLNNVEVGPFFGTNVLDDAPFGIYLEKTNRYQLQENFVTQTQPQTISNPDYGIYVNETGRSKELIYLNHLDNLIYSLPASDENFGTLWECNRMSNARGHQLVAFSGANIGSQGSCGFGGPPAGNKFTACPPSISQIWKNDFPFISYFHDDNDIPIPTCTRNVNLTVCASPDATCPSKLNHFVVHPPVNPGVITGATGTCLRCINDDIGALRTGLLGNWSSLLATVNGYSMSASAMKNLLVGQGDRLIDEILLDAVIKKQQGVNTPFFSDAELGDILLANSPHTEVVMAAVRERVPALDSTVLQQIETAQTNSLTGRLDTMNAIYALEHKKAQIYNTFISFALDDSTSAITIDQVIDSLQLEHDVESRMKLFEMYVVRDSLSIASQALDSIKQYNEDIRQYEKFYRLYLSLRSTGRGWSDIDPASEPMLINDLWSIAGTHTKASANATNVLSLLLDTTFHELIEEVVACDLTGNLQSQPASCGNCDGSVTANINTTNSLLAYQWSGPNLNVVTNLPELNNVCPGNYSVTVTDTGGCTLTLATVVEDDCDCDSIEMNLSINDTLFCMDDTIEFTITSNVVPILGAFTDIYENIFPLIPSVFHNLINFNHTVKVRIPVQEALSEYIITGGVNFFCFIQGDFLEDDDCEPSISCVTFRIDTCYNPCGTFALNSNFSWGKSTDANADPYTYIFTNSSSLHNGLKFAFLEWDFGDGNTLTVAPPQSLSAPVSYAFSAPPPHTVCLTVYYIDPVTYYCCEDVHCVLIPLGACDTLDLITVVNSEPDDDYTFHFNAVAPSLPVEQYLWTFGDGSGGTGEFVDHTYDEMGYYDVCVTVIYHFSDVPDICCPSTDCDRVCIGDPLQHPQQQMQMKCVGTQLNSVDGKDAMILSSTIDADMAKTNFSDYECVMAHSISTGLVFRSLIDFPLPSILPDDELVDAKLTLYNSMCSQHNHEGNGTVVLRRITSPWNESMVTWENQPATTEANQILISADLVNFNSEGNTEINVTPLVQDILKAPESSYGFMLILQDESVNTGISFGSSDNFDANRRPKVDICYRQKTSTGIPENNTAGSIKVYPNPSEGIFNIDLEDVAGNNRLLQVTDINGKTVLELKECKNRESLDFTKMNNGVYVIRVTSSTRSFFAKVVKI